MGRVVMVFGTFDGVHPGHLDFFRQALKRGDALLVVVARDATVRSVKGRRPQRNERSRRAAVAARPMGSKAVLGDPHDQMKAIAKYQPSVVCLGYDQQAFVEQLYRTFPRLKIIRLKPYQPERYKSSHFNAV